MHRLIKIVLFTWLSWSLTGQSVWPIQDERLMQINPAYVALQNQWSIGAFYNKRWSNLTSSPKTYQLSAQIPFSYDKMGLGLLLDQEILGPFKTSSFQINYAYGFEVGLFDGDKLQLGLGSQFATIRLDNKHFIAQTESDPFLQNAGVEKNFRFSVNSGFLYSSKDYRNSWTGTALKFGMGLNNFLGSALQFENFRLSQKTQLVGSAGVAYRPDQNWELATDLLYAQFTPENTFSLREQVAWKQTFFISSLIDFKQSIQTALQIHLPVDLRNAFYLNLGVNKYWYNANTQQYLDQNFELTISLIKKKES